MKTSKEFGIASCQRRSLTDCSALEMDPVFINKGPQSEAVWRTSPEDRLAITRHLKQDKGKSKRRGVDGKTYVLSSSGRWRLIRTLQIPIEPLTILDRGRIDPFITYPVPDVSVSSRTIIDHALCHTWPSIVPTQDDESNYLVQATWLEHMQRSPASFYAYQYGASAHRALLKEGLYGLLSNEDHLLELKALALKHLKKEVSVVQNPTPDHLFTTIIALGAHEVHPRAVEFARSQYARSVMAKTQTLDLISNMTFVQAHMDVLYALVAQRGGLRQIQSPGVAVTIALADLIFATVSVTRPRLECYWPADLVGISQSTIEETNLIFFGENFEVLDDHLKTELKDFLQLLPYIREVTVMIARYHQTNGKAPPLVTIISLRNYVQWQLLSLQNLTPFKKDFTMTNIIQAVRIAALIFSNLEIFPLGPARGHQDIHATALRVALELGPRCHALLELWLLTMGGIAAEHTDRQKWYLTRFREVAHVLYTSSIPFFLEVMRRFLWWDVTCLDPAMEFWTRAFASATAEDTYVESAHM